MGFSTGGIPTVGEGRGEGQDRGGFQHGGGGGGEGQPGGGFKPRDFSFILVIVGRHELLPG